jgi:hypothetical protein
MSASAVVTSSVAASMATEFDVLRAQKLMQSSFATELNKSRHGMSRAKLDCAKGIETVQAFATYV